MGFRRAIREVYWPLKPRYVRWRLGIARSTLHLDFHGAGIGLFAQLTAILLFLRHARARGFLPVITLSSDNYLDPALPPDWFGYFFGLVHPATASPLPLRIGNFEELPAFPTDLTLLEARALFFAYVMVKPDIVAEADAFRAAHAIGAPSLGIHYRGTDKAEEAVRLSYETVYQAIADALRARPDLENLFVASDEQAFLDGVAARFPDRRVVAFADSVKAADGRPVHLGPRTAGNYRMGRDALVNALILSRCGALLRTTSFLSAWASIFNPALHVTLLNRPYDHKLWYPEREILKTATVLG